MCLDCEVHCVVAEERWVRGWSVCWLKVNGERGCEDEGTWVEGTGRHLSGRCVRRMGWYGIPEAPSHLQCQYEFCLWWHETDGVLRHPVSHLQTAVLALCGRRFGLLGPRWLLSCTMQETCCCLVASLIALVSRRQYQQQQHHHLHYPTPFWPFMSQALTEIWS